MRNQYHGGLFSKIVSVLCMALVALCLRPLGAQAVDQVIKISAANGADLLAAGTWNVAVPGAADVAVFTNTTSAKTYNLSANTEWQGIAKRYTAFATTITNVNNILTNGTSGIDMSLAMGALTINTKGLELKGSQTWAVTNSRQLTVASIISGNSASTLTKSDVGTLALSGANTYDGQTLITAGNLIISNGLALGSTVGNTMVSSGAALTLHNGITVAEPLTLSGSGVSVNGALRSANGNNTYSGLITLTNGVRITSAGGSLLHITGGITNPAVAGSAALTLTAQGGNISLESGFQDIANKGLLLYGPSTNFLNVAGTAHNFTTVQLAYDVVTVLGFNDALPTGVTLSMGAGGAGQPWAGTLEMNGKNQTVGKLQSNSITNLDTVVIHNSDATLSTLTINQSANSSYGGRISNNLALVKSGAGILTLTNSANTYTGGTTINNGTLNLVGASTLGSGNISIGSSGTLNMSGNALTLASTQMLTNRGTVGGGLVIGNGAFATGGGKYQTVTNALGGTLTPGTGGDTNFFSDLTLNGGSTNAFWLGSAATHDMSIVTNSLNYGGDNPLLKLDLTAWSSTPPETVVLFDNTFTGGGWNGTNQVFQLADWGAGANGAMLLTNGASFWAVGGSSATNLFTIRYDYDVGSSTFGSGNDIALMTVIPEPASLNLLAMLGTAYFMRRRIHRKRGRWNF